MYQFRKETSAERFLQQPGLELTYLGIMFSGLQIDCLI